MDIGRTLPAELTQDLLAEVLSYKSLFAALTKLVPDAVIQLDAAGKVERWNLGAEALTGYTAHGMLGIPLRDVLPDDQFDAIEALPADGQVQELRLRFRDAAGKPLDVRGKGMVLHSGAVREGWLIACSAARHLDEIEQLKNEFVSSVSHELKTPLTAIKAYCATLLSNPGLNEAQRTDYLSVIDQQTDRLTRLIDDLLLVTRVEGGQMLKRRVRLSLDSLLERVCEALAHDPALHAIVVECDGVRVSGDPDRLADVLTHLLDNAVKYSPNGGTILISASEENGATLISIRDEGIGIDEEHVPFIFDRFYRIDSELTPYVGGNGLGLFLVNALVRAHGGKIEVRSDPGTGSTFTLSLPVRE